jgi:hypothetical protein
VTSEGVCEVSDGGGSGESPEAWLKSAEVAFGMFR